ncbi:MAG: NDP-sugar synthase [Vicinamibacteria bacterium]|nr:NDP-sugar synthase [Vicinamibacteria bacterium]
MKAMVLAAGLGRRMRPLSSIVPKPVMPVLNRPLIHWTLEQLARHGVRDVVVNLHHLPDVAARIIGRGRRFGLRIVYSREDVILGTGGGLKMARGFFGDEAFLVVNGDVVFDIDLRSLMRRHRDSGALATLALRPNPDPRLYSAVVVGEDGFVRAIAGRPIRARGVAALFTGIHVLDAALLDRLPAGPSDSVRDLYLPLLAEGEPLFGARMRGRWYDFGSPQTYLRSQLRMLGRGFRDVPAAAALVHHTVRAGRGARIARSIVGPRVTIGAGAVVEQSVIWTGARVGRDALVRGSILADNAYVPRDRRIVGRILMGSGAGVGI